MSLAVTFQALWNKFCFCSSPKHLTGLTALWRKQDFPQLPSSTESFLDLLCQHLFTQALLWQNCFSRSDRQRQCCYSRVSWGDNCLKHPGDFLEGDQKTIAAPGDNYNWCPNGELLAAKRQTFPSDFCGALVPIDYWGKCIMLAKISFPWSNVCFISHVNASMTLSLLQHIKHLGNVSLNSRSVLWNPSTWE